MDVRMPGLDGIAATEQILSTQSAPPRILVLTIFESDGYVRDALRVGATGFLLKRADPAEVVHAVRLAAHSESLLYPAAIRDLATRREPTGDRARLGTVRLTGREAEILRLMAQGLSNGEIGGRLYLTVGTVKTHVSSILIKLAARDRTQAVIIAYESGFITPAP
jgi:DNA-binding NarL/FixJ family response regulator